jgi:MraZ protein
VFLGQYSHTLDAKGRITIPARFREELDSGLVITRGYDPCLIAYPEAEWIKLAKKIAEVPKTNHMARSYGRFVFGGASEATLDSAGRVLIPPFLREYAHLEQEAIVVGVNTYIEIWEPEIWHRTFDSDAENMDAILTEMTRMGV